MPSLLDHNALAQRDSRGDETEGMRLQCRDLAVRADSVRAEDRSVLAMISTDAPVVVRDYATWDLIEETLVARGAQFTPHVPILGGHRHYHELGVYGHVAEHREVDGGYESRLYFSEEANERDPVSIVWQRVKGKHLRGVSIGYEPLEYTDIAPGKSAKVNGRNYSAGRMRLRVTRSYLIYEVSVVPIGADPNALMQMRRRSLSSAAAPRRPRRFLTTPLSTPTAGARRRPTRNA